ncbi:MAG: hypothetical protein JSS81_11480 [Acidobacteria bacterium]|nr:hypothetical protein [Acidobacteriota bacterium]
MAFGFPARFVESRKYELREEKLPAVVRSAFENLGWHGYTTETNAEFRVSLRSSLLTWGESFSVSLFPGGTIKAESRCVTGLMPQIFDFGVNRQNVDKFFAEVERLIAETQS